MGKTITDWLSEGESLYAAAVAEHQQIQQEVDEMERKLEAKRHEINQLAHVLGKAPIEGSHRVAPPVPPPTATPVPEKRTQIPLNGGPATSLSRALAGR